MDPPGELIHGAEVLAQSEELSGCLGADTNVLLGRKCAAPSDLAGRASSWTQWLHDPMVSLQSAECPGRQRDPHPVGHMVVRNGHSLQPKTDDQPGHLPMHRSGSHKGLKPESVHHDLRWPPDPWCCLNLIILQPVFFNDKHVPSLSSPDTGRGSWIFLPRWPERVRVAMLIRQTDNSDFLGFA